MYIAVVPWGECVHFTPSETPHQPFSTPLAEQLLHLPELIAGRHLGSGFGFASLSLKMAVAGVEVGRMTDDREKSELDDLQEKFRVLENKFKKKSSQGDNPESSIRMQRQQITKLKLENDRAKEDLELETRQAKQANDTSASLQISKLRDQADFYKRKITQEIRKIDALDQNIHGIQSNICHQSTLLNFELFVQNSSKIRR